MSRNDQQTNSQMRETWKLETDNQHCLPIETCDPVMELRRNKLRLRFLYRLRSNSTYTVSLNTLDNRENQNYVGNEGATKPTEVQLRKLEQGYMKKQREVEENHLAQQPP